MAHVDNGAVLITGAGRRVGRAIALALGADGWSVVVHYNRSRADADEVVAMIRDSGGTAEAFGADLLDESAVADLVPKATERIGPVTALVNNASVFEPDDPETATRATWDRHMNVNLRAPFVLCQEMARALPHGLNGAIVNIVDQRVWNLTPHFTSYTLSKAGLWTLTQTLALALAPRIRVNAIGPGPTAPSTRQSQAEFDEQAMSVPLNHGSSPGEIADGVRFLLRTPAMTGQMLCLDGGEHMAWAQPAFGYTPKE